MRVIAHGGAGSAVDRPGPRQAALDAAARVGAEAGSPVDAVERTVRALETDPAFNAGVGGAVQSDGVVRTDAAVMTADRRVGAACSMPGVEHAVSVARVVMAETPHVLVSGENAVDLGRDFGVGTAVDLTTPATRRRWRDLDPPAPAPDAGSRPHLEWVRGQFGGADTVGAVAVDGESLAAATSTGGRWCALAGRVGDVPQVGAGFYASPAGGVSATGAGEDIARATLARRAVDSLAAGRDADAAARRAMADFHENTGAPAGLVVAGADGTVGSAHTSEAMQTAVADG